MTRNAFSNFFQELTSFCFTFLQLRVHEKSKLSIFSKAKKTREYGKKFQDFSFTKFKEKTFMTT